MKKLYLSADNSTWIDSSTYGIYLNSDTYLNAPAFDYTEYSVPARNGNLIAYNNRYGNVLRRFDCYINASVETNFDAFKKWIYTHPGYVYIKSDYDTTTFQKGYLAQDIQAEPFNKDGNYSIQFSIYFSCQPQKFSTTTTKYMPDYTLHTSMYDRNHPKVKCILNQLPNEYIPNDRFFFLQQAAVGTINYTNFNVSWSGGSCFACVFETNDPDYEEPTDIIDVSLDSISNLSFSETGTYDYVFILIGFRDSGTITCNFKANGTTADRSINNLGQNMAIVNGGTNCGVDIGDLTITMYSDGTNTEKYSYILFRRYLGTDLVGEGIIYILIPSTANVTGYTTAHGSDYSYDLVINTDRLTCRMVKSGMPDVNFNNYINIVGDFDGYCDKVTAQVIATGNWGTGYAYTMTFRPTWWKL